VGDPGIELGLGLLDRGEAPVGEELLAKALVEALDLAGGGRGTHLRVSMRDAVLPTDPVEIGRPLVAVLPDGATSWSAARHE
jgi:hypothetical protein